MENTEQKIRLQLGKRYLTRGGLETSPLKFAQNGTNYKFQATIQEPGYDDLSVRAWLENGHFLALNIENRFDLIAEIN